MKQCFIFDCIPSEDTDTDLEQQALHQVVKKSMESLWKLVRTIIVYVTKHIQSHCTHCATDKGIGCLQEHAVGAEKGVCCYCTLCIDKLLCDT